MFDSTEHDDLLFTMLGECKTLPIFLNHVFGFLNRRTDFYYTAADPNCPVGLLPGLAEQTVKQICDKWNPMNKILINEDFAENLSTQPSITLSSKLLKLLEANTVFTTSDSYNGAIYDNYRWSQTLLEVTISIEVPENTRAKDLSVKIQSDQISVKLNNGTVLLEGILCEKCKYNDTIWSLANQKLDIHLDKLKEVWWNCLVRSEPKLDISTLDCSRPFDELSEEAQAKLEELQWNQKQKRLGLLTTGESQIQDMLKKS